VPVQIIFWDFSLLMSKEQPVETAHKHSGNERRRTVRYECEGEAEIVRIPSPGFRDCVKIQNLSLGGCRLAMKDPHPPATQLELLLKIGLLTLRVTGKVRARYKDGMGVEFDQMTAGARMHLRDLVIAYEAKARIPAG
jgi:hypothetical protein